MAATFDRETLLDLVVNVIPLAIILFFVAAFAVAEPFGGDSLGRVLQFGLLLFPFLALAILTYVSGKVIASDERRAEVYHQGQATMDDADPRHGGHAESADAESGGDDAPSEAEATSADETPTESDAATADDTDVAETADEAATDDTAAADGADQDGGGTDDESDATPAESADD